MQLSSSEGISICNATQTAPGIIEDVLIGLRSSSPHNSEVLAVFCPEATGVNEDSFMWFSPWSVSYELYHFCCWGLFVARGARCCRGSVGEMLGGDHRVILFVDSYIFWDSREGACL